MMKAVIPHLRLLTLPIDQLDPISKYLSDLQIAFLAKRLIFKDENRAGVFHAALNLSTESRSRPKSQKFKLDFIAEDLIKDDWEMLGAETKKSIEWNCLTLELVAEQHLVLKGVEILTRANNSPKIEFVNNDDEATSR